MARPWWQGGPVGDFFVDEIVEPVIDGWNQSATGSAINRAVGGVASAPWGDIISGAGNAGLGQPRLANQAVNQRWSGGDTSISPERQQALDQAAMLHNYAGMLNNLPYSGNRSDQARATEYGTDVLAERNMEIALQDQLAKWAEAKLADEAQRQRMYEALSGRREVASQMGPPIAAADWRPLPTEEDRMKLRGPLMPYMEPRPRPEVQSWTPVNPMSAGPVGQKLSDMLQWLGGNFTEGATGFTDTAGHWTDTKPVTLHPLRNVDSRPKVSYSRPPRTNPSKGASEGRIEHQQYRPETGQPQYSSNITSGAAQRTNQLADFLADAARQAQIRQALQGMTFGGF